MGKTEKLSSNARAPYNMLRDRSVPSGEHKTDGEVYQSCSVGGMIEGIGR